PATAAAGRRGGRPGEMIETPHPPAGKTSRELEFYLSGNVQIRQRTLEGTRLLTTDEIYLDANRHVAIAAGATLSFQRKLVPQPIVVRADELRQLSETRFQVLKAEVFSSKLPSDPGLKILFTEATIDEVKVPRRALFGGVVLDRQGRPTTETEHPIKGTNARVELEGVPVFYTPYFVGDAEHPLGPVQGIHLGQNRIFGAQLGATFDVYQLFGARAYTDTRWRAYVDYLSRRGPGVGTEFDYASPVFFGLPARVSGVIKAYGMNDKATDILGGGRGDPSAYPQDNHPENRGRLLWRQNVLDLPEGFTLQTQLAWLSDRNFFEQYYKLEFDTDINQSTFVYVKQQQDVWAW